MGTSSIESSALQQMAQLQMYRQQMYQQQMNQQQYVASSGLSSTLYYKEHPMVEQKRRKTMLGEVKEYIGKHKDVIFTLGLVILIDHFLFEGALRNRIKGTVEGVIKNLEDRLAIKGGGTKDGTAK
mgnify:FL=1